MSKKKEVAVIGAGTSGLIAIKCLKEEGFEPVCFEKSSYYGGLWKYHEEDVDGVPSVMWSTSLNNSKEVGALSDFPPDPKYPNFMRHFNVLQMFSQYAEKFDLLRHIHYNREVTRVQRARDYSTTGRWKVCTKDTESGDVSERIFDAVMVCIGHLTIPNLPTFPNMEAFKGDIIHTHSLKRFRQFERKTVCVIGTGSSALDSAVEISHLANQVYLSVRTPNWICTRNGPYGYPIDWVTFSWEHNVYHKYLPLSWTNKFCEEVFINPRFSHRLYNINPERGVANRDFAVNDSISSRMMNGAVIMKKNVKCFTKNGVIFHDDHDQETRVDAVVLGTGYQWRFPFLDSCDFVTEGSKIHLYKCVYPPHLPFPTLGIVGFIVPLGPGFPCVEMQCRWFASTLTGRNKLPCKKDMMKHVDNQYKENLERYGESSRVYVHVDFMPYLEDLASEFGACPSMLNLLLTDFRLFVTCAFGAYVPYRFRLCGPHKWNKAREAILDAGKRMRAPLQGKKAFETNAKSSSTRLYFLACFAISIGYVARYNLVNKEHIMGMYRFYLMAKYLLLNIIKNGNVETNFIKLYLK